MGKGDKKTKRGKIVRGSYGVRRPKKKHDAYKPVVKKEEKVIATKIETEEPKEKKPAATKAPAKKAPAKKTAAKKTETAVKKEAKVVKAEKAENKDVTDEKTDSKKE